MPNGFGSRGAEFFFLLRFVGYYRRCLTIFFRSVSRAQSLILSGTGLKVASSVPFRDKAHDGIAADWFSERLL